MWRLNLSRVIVEKVILDPEVPQVHPDLPGLAAATVQYVHTSNTLFFQYLHLKTLNFVTLLFCRHLLTWKDPDSQTSAYVELNLKCKIILKEEIEELTMTLFLICYPVYRRSSRSPRPSRTPRPSWYFSGTGIQWSSSIWTTWTTWAGWSPWSTSEFLYSYTNITSFSVDRDWALNCNNCDELLNTDLLYLSCLLLSGASRSPWSTRSTRTRRTEGEEIWNFTVTNGCWPDC